MGLFDSIVNGFQQVVDSLASNFRIPVYPNNYLKDVFGRSLIIHGLNVCNAAKRAPGHLPWQQLPDFKKFVTDWGFNGVRLLVFWSDVEPERGKYNDAYISSIAGLVNNLKACGIWTIVDFHQDLYAEKFTGDGAPAWAIHDHDLPFSPVSPWALNYLQPAVMVAFQNFWSTSLRNDYLAMIKYTMAKIRSQGTPGTSNIIAVDVMNEPFKADLFNFETTTLTKFYNDFSAANSTERTGIEPAIIADAGIPSSVGFEGPGPGIYLPHYYDAVFQTTGYNPVVEQMIWTSVKNRVNDSNRIGVPLLFGEIGAGSNSPGYLDYTDKLLQVADAHNVGWMWYCYDKVAESDMGIYNNDATERPVMQFLVRIYARAIGGSNFQYGYEGKKFWVTWRQVAGLTAPTEIFIPPRFRGIQVLINEAPSQYTPNPARPNILNVATTAPSMKVEVFWA